MAHNLQKRLTLEYIYLLNVSISFYSVLWKKQAKLELSENKEKEVAGTRWLVQSIRKMAANLIQDVVGCLPERDGDHQPLLSILSGEIINWCEGISTDL